MSQLFEKITREIFGEEKVASMITWMENGDGRAGAASLLPQGVGASYDREKGMIMQGYFDNNNPIGMVDHHYEHFSEFSPSRFFYDSTGIVYGNGLWYSQDCWYIGKMQGGRIVEGIKINTKNGEIEKGTFIQQKTSFSSSKDKHQLICLEGTHCTKIWLCSNGASEEHGIGQIDPNEKYYGIVSRFCSSTIIAKQAHGEFSNGTLIHGELVHILLNKKVTAQYQKTGIKITGVLPCNDEKPSQVEYISRDGGTRQILSLKQSYFLDMECKSQKGRCLYFEPCVVDAYFQFNEEKGFTVLEDKLNVKKECMGVFYPDLILNEGTIKWSDGKSISGTFGNSDGVKSAQGWWWASHDHWEYGTWENYRRIGYGFTESSVGGRRTHTYWGKNGKPMLFEVIETESKQYEIMMMHGNAYEDEDDEEDDRIYLSQMTIGDLESLVKLWVLGCNGQANCPSFDSLVSATFRNCIELTWIWFTQIATPQQIGQHYNISNESAQLLILVFKNKIQPQRFQKKLLNKLQTLKNELEELPHSKSRY